MEKHLFVEDDVLVRNYHKTPKKEIIIKVSFKGRWELFWLKVKLFGIGRYFGVKFKDIRELIKPKKLRVLYG